uniref:Uncharacterized protein n=1 Tax=Physcomitrium patens TaxID=3218 RepID=A0A2K1L9S4_PHYPA|nr:hypothetical protein PHYPA_001187 [Physcomitrium patens]
MRPDKDVVDLSSDEGQPTPLKRPMGTKKAKEIVRKNVDEDDELAGIQRSYVVEARRLNDLIEAQNRLALFSVDLIALDDIAR